MDERRKEGKENGSRIEKSRKQQGKEAEERSKEMKRKRKKRKRKEKEQGKEGEEGEKGGRKKRGEGGRRKEQHTAFNGGFSRVNQGFLVPYSRGDTFSVMMLHFERRTDFSDRELIRINKEAINFRGIP